MVNSSGTVTAHVVYGSFGNVVTHMGAVPRFAFAGRELDAETHLYYNRLRYYDAGTGRFLSEDPSGFRGGDDNLYRYVGNSPLSFTDPMGLSGDEAGAGEHEGGDLGTFVPTDDSGRPLKPGQELGAEAGPKPRPSLPPGMSASRNPPSAPPGSQGTATGPSLLERLHLWLNQVDSAEKEHLGKLQAIADGAAGTPSESMWKWPEEYWKAYFQALPARMHAWLAGLRPKCLKDQGGGQAAPNSAPKGVPKGLDGEPIDTTKWRQGAQKFEPATGNAYPDCTSVETEFTNTETGETVTNHSILRNSDGTVIHNHSRPGPIK